MGDHGNLRKPNDISGIALGRHGFWLLADNLVSGKVPIHGTVGLKTRDGVLLGLGLHAICSTTSKLDPLKRLCK